MRGARFSVGAVLALAIALPAAAHAQAPACPCTVFAPSDAPAGNALQDAALEVGMKFRSSEDGYVTALRFYKQPNNTGTHVGHLWSSSGQQLAEVTFSSETPSGWQEEPLPTPVAIAKDTTYITSYHSSSGFFAASGGFFNTSVDRPPLSAPANGPANGNGVYRYGPSGFPTDTFNATNYWVDVKFERTPPGDTRPPQVGSVAPADGATAVAPQATVKATFDEPIDAATITTASFRLTDAQGNAIASAVAYDGPSRTATLTPSAPLPYGKTFTAVVKGGATGVADTAANRLAADRTWSFSSARACPCTVFGSGEAPLGDADSDQPVEVGMKFRSTEDGFITALRFYKQPGNTGVHVGHLWSSSGQQLAEVTFSAETPSGWQEEELPQPVAISKDTTYVTSYYAAAGRYARDQGFFNLSRGDSPLYAPSDSLAGGNGVYSYGPSSFPSASFAATNYWVDASFERTRPPDIRPPRVAAVTPASGATGAPVSSKVTATFDEPIDRLTVNTGSVLLKDDAGNPVVGTVTYDDATRTATLTPSAPLQFGKTYTATIKSGSAGVTDAAGNRLAADKGWSFSTPAECPCTVFTPSEAPTGSAAEDQPVEVGMKFRSNEDGYITHLRFYKQPSNTGKHVGHLWSGTGELLAVTTFTNETASGWQQVELPNPVAVTKDTTYVTSYHSSAGRYAFTPGYFGSDHGQAPLRGLADGPAAGNGVYKYGPGGFPDATFNATNYWVDATFQRTVPPDTRGPSILATVPENGAGDVSRSADVTVTFDEALNAASVTGTTFTLRDADGLAIAATVSYDAQTRTAVLHPQAPLSYGTGYTAQLKGGTGGVTDAAGNPLAADKVWSFSVLDQPPQEGPGGPILLVTNPADKFSHYYAEILRGEGLNEFTTVDGPVTSGMLTGKTTVLLATAAVSDAEASLLSAWVEGGGNLIAMRPDKKLAGLLGLTDAGGTLLNGYLKVDTGSAAGAGIDTQTLQYHGTADRYALSGATALATLYSTINAATTNPAVTLRDVGGAGGQAAAFTYDLARSVVYTRQGNPAWAGQKRDGTPNGIRSNDLFYGAKAGDVQPDWVDPKRFAVPQADEQQRLLANLVTQMNLDKAPLPRFSYLPDGDKAAIVLTGDDHAKALTPAYFDRLKSYSPAGCSVADWECIRATSYMYPDTAISDAQAAAYEAQGFELALHLNTGCADYTPASIETMLTNQLGAFAGAWPSVRPPVSNRTHCIVWSDWASQAKAERRHGIRFDTNYYYNGPPAWLKAPGLMTGSGFPQRFADLDGTLIDVYQAMTQVSDEADATLPTTTQIHTLLDNALGPKGYYGVFTVILHSDLGDHTRLNDLTAEAIDRDVPVVTSSQMLDWLDGRNRSAFANIAYSGGQLDFSISTNSKARRLEALLPARSATGPLSRLTRNGQTVSWSRRTLKGVDYVAFKALGGSYRATYATDTSAPDITAVSASADAEGHATVQWTTDEPSTSLVEYGRTTSLGSEVSETAQLTRHSIELANLQPNTTYSFRVTSADSAGNRSTSPPTGSPAATFSTPPGTLVDSRFSEFAAGTQSNTWAGATLAGSDGEAQLKPTVGDEFEGMLLPLGWSTSSWFSGGSVQVAGGALSANGAAAKTVQLFDPPQTVEFTATFRPVNDQGVGFGNDFSDFPTAAFTTGLSGQPYQIYATSGASSSVQAETPLPSVSLNAPHRFRVEWRPTSIAYYVDGVLVATHNITIDGPMRPVASDYNVFGADVKVSWLRQGPYATSGTMTSRVLDSGPGANDWGTLSATTKTPAGTSIKFQTRSGGTSSPDASWSSWQNLGTGNAIASPDARFIQYRAQMTGTATATPTLERVQIGFTAGADRAPVPGTVSLSPAAPRTNQTVTATPAGFSDPDGDTLSYRYQWYRNGTAISGATGSTLNLNSAGNGDRGDVVKVEVYATDGRGAASDAVVAKTTVANTAPTAGTVAIKPAAPATNDVVQAVPSGFADIDGDTLSYTYKWFRNGVAISGATGRTLDLAVAGNGDLNDRIEAEVVAVDGFGGSSPAKRGAATVTGTNATPVAGTVAITPAAPKTNQTLTATPSGFRDPDGDPITYAYKWFRNGTAISGATGATLDLAVAGNGDRGDKIRADVTATDSKGAVSDPASDTATVANSAPTAGTVTIRPAGPGTDDIVSAMTTGFADDDGDSLTYEYQWIVNGTPLSSATGRSFDLSVAGHGDTGDRIEVEVTALDGNNGTSPSARAADTVTSAAASPVAAFGFEEATGNVAVNEGGAQDGAISGATRTNTGRFGRALSFDGDDDIVEVPDDAALRLTTGMTLEAWVRPTATTDWRTVLFKESDGGAAYTLYANGEVDVPHVYAGSLGVAGQTELDPSEWTHLAASYDGAVLRFFVNGTQVGAKAMTGDLASGAGPLTLGANHVWGERFRGYIDEVRVYNRALTREAIAADMDRPVIAGTPRPPVDTQPEAIGKFSAPLNWPITPVHLAMLSNGKVAAWDGFEAAVNSEHTWDPWTGQFDSIPNGGNLFCAGHITLTDGRLLVAGGHIQAYEGTKETNLLDPRVNTWARGADMSVARWYPSATALPDGRVFVISGDTITLGQYPNATTPVPLINASDTLPEIYNPTTNAWTAMPSASRKMPLYPFMFLLPNGKLFDAGPDTVTRTLDLSTGQWTTVGTSPVDGQSAVMYRPGKIMKSGTWSDPEFPDRQATDRAAAIDMTAASPAWREIAPMKYRRSYHTLTSLPDGTVLATGGQTTTDGVDEKSGVLPAEIWDPATDKWTTMASSRRPRLYHSSAVLLPDGRVLLAGGGAYGNARNEKSGEIFSPPYLFKGPRPAVTAAPSEIHYGQSFSVDTPDAARISSVSLVRMGSVTHNFDFDQRYIPLTMSPQGDGLSISAPGSANLAPPGFYMVFLIDQNGVPSVGQIVRLDPRTDTQAPTAPGNLARTVLPDGARLTWSASSDNVGVDEYRVFRSTTSGFTPSAANRIARVKGATGYTDDGRSAGTYFYKVRAADAAGNLSPASAQVSATVTGDTTAPTVSLTAPAANASLSGSTTLTATAADAVGVKSVQFKLDGQDLGSPDTASPYSLSWDTRTAPDGRHTLTAVARDGTGNATTSAGVAVEVHNTGLVAAYGFEEASGATAVDTAGRHDGAISGALRTTTGRFGQALSFDGVDDLVSVPHDPSLDLASGFTIEAWVRPAALGDWRSVVLKERTGSLDYALYGSSLAGPPTARVFTNSDIEAPATAALGLSTWTHLAMTWDGAALRMFIDGAEVAVQPAPGPLVTSTGLLRIGGNSLRGEWFNGLIDEVRIYDRPLSEPQIGADMNAAVKP